MTEKEESVKESDSLIARLTAKLEKSGESENSLREQLEQRESQLHQQMESFETCVGETRKEYEDMLQQKDSMVDSLKEMVRVKDSEAGASKAEKGLLQLVEQKAKDTQDVLNSKLKVIEVLQSEVGDKEKHLLEQGTTIKTLTDKFQVSQEQTEILQQNFVSMETQWKEEKDQLLEQLKSGQESYNSVVQDSTNQLQQLQAAVQQWEAAYNQVNSQLTAIQEQNGQVQADLETAKKSAEAGQEHHKQLLASQADLETKSKTIDELHKKLEDMNAKASAKFTKFKAQSVAKVKALEKQLEEVQQVKHLNIFSIFY